PLGDPLLAAVLARFWQQADVIVFVFLGIGCARAMPFLFGYRHAPAWVLTAALITTRLMLSFQVQDESHNDVVARYARALLEPLPRGALLLTKGDLVTNSIRYAQACEHVRPDVTVLDQELMTKRWYVERAARNFPGVLFPGRVYHPGLPDGFTMRDFLQGVEGSHDVSV